MAMFAMVASLTYQHHGFFTPLFHIASTFLSPGTMMTSAQHAMAGQNFFFAFGPAILGAIVHMMIGAMYGAVLGVAVSLVRSRARGAALIAAGAVWGVIVFVVSSWIALPIAASLFGSGDQITHMARMVGYPTFLIEHIIFGATAGAALLRWRSRR